MGFFTNFYYGKAGKADFNPEDLPGNRFALFFDMLRIRMGSLVGMNLIYVLFCLPAIILTFLTAMLIMQSVPVEGAAEAAVPMTEGILPYISQYLMLMILPQALCGVGAVGMNYVLRNWARDQHSFFFSDFKDSIKRNWKQGLIVGLLNGLVSLLVFVAFMFYWSQGGGNALFYMLSTLVVIIGCIWWMMNVIVFPMIITYEMKLSHILRNALILTLGRLPFALAVWVGSLLPLIAVFLIPNNIALLVFVLLYAVIGFSLTGFVYASYANSVFDKYINPRIDGAPVNMGLRGLDEFDDEPESDSRSGDAPNGDGK